MVRFNFRETFPSGPEEFIRRTMYDFDYVKFVPNITRVEQLYRETLEDGREIIAVRVFAKADIPAAIRAVFKMSIMDWKEIYTVDMKNLSVDWRIETPMFTEYVECGGASNFKAVAGGCEMTVSGSMRIKTPPIKGVPAPVVEGVVRLIEPFIGNMVTMNLKKYFKSVRESLEKEAAEAKKQIK